MGGKPNNANIPWDEESLGSMRQIFRVVADDKFRSGERKNIDPTAVDIAKKYNLFSDDDWKTFVCDLPVAGKVLKDLEMDTAYASYLIQYLVKIMQLPIRPEWYRKSFVQAWERNVNKPKKESP